MIKPETIEMIRTCNDEDIVLMTLASIQPIYKSANDEIVDLLAGTWYKARMPLWIGKLSALIAEGFFCKSYIQESWDMGFLAQVRFVGHKEDCSGATKLFIAVRIALEYLMYESEEIYPFEYAFWFLDRIQSSFQLNPVQDVLDKWTEIVGGDDKRFGEVVNYVKMEDFLTNV